MTIDPYLTLTLGLCGLVCIGLIIVAEYISRGDDQ